MIRHLGIMFRNIAGTKNGSVLPDLGGIHNVGYVKIFPSIWQRCIDISCRIPWKVIVSQKRNSSFDTHEDFLRFYYGWKIKC